MVFLPSIRPVLVTATAVSLYHFLDFSDRPDLLLYGRQSPGDHVVQLSRPRFQLGRAVVDPGPGDRFLPGVDLFSPSSQNEPGPPFSAFHLADRTTDNPVLIPCFDHDASRCDLVGKAGVPVVILLPLVSWQPDDRVLHDCLGDCVRAPALSALHDDDFNGGRLGRSLREAGAAQGGLSLRHDGCFILMDL